VGYLSDSSVAAAGLCLGSCCWLPACVAAVGVQLVCHCRTTCVPCAGASRPLMERLGHPLTGHSWLPMMPCITR
jgi:hypothetical protein